MTRIRISSIYSHGRDPAPTGSAAQQRNEALFREAWQRHGLAVLDPATIVDEWFRQAVINHATKLFGKRGK